MLGVNKPIREAHMRKIEISRSELSTQTQMALEMAANCHEIRQAIAEISRGYEKMGIIADTRVSVQAQWKAKEIVVYSLQSMMWHSKRLLKLGPPQASVLKVFECSRLALLACDVCSQQQVLPAKCGVNEILIRMASK